MFHMYDELSHKEAWKDHVYRVKLLRDRMVMELLQGSLDKFGCNHDDEKRAVLTVLDSILEFPTSLKNTYHHLEKKQQELAAKANADHTLHGTDTWSMFDES